MIIKRCKSNTLLYIATTCLFLGIGGCSSPLDIAEKAEEKVYIYIVQPDQSPAKDFPVTLGDTGDSTDIGMIVDPTDEDGKTEASLPVGATYEAYLVIDDDTTQYEKFTVSENAEDNEFIFMFVDWYETKSYAVPFTHGCQHLRTMYNKSGRPIELCGSRRPCDC